MKKTEGKEEAKKVPVLSDFRRRLGEACVCFFLCAERFATSNRGSRLVSAPYL